MRKLTAVLAGLAVAVAVAIAVPAYSGEPLRQQIAALTRQVAVLRAEVRALGREKRTVEESRAELRARLAHATNENTALRRAVAQERGCPVTEPNGSSPPGQTPSSAYHGNASLWILLWTRGVAVAGPEYVRPDGSVDLKFGWWRGVEGKLTITGRRIDGVAPPLSAHVPDGYAPSGFQASGIVFPTEGCWEITGMAGGASLIFVVFLVKS